MLGSTSKSPYKSLSSIAKLSSSKNEKKKNHYYQNLVYTPEPLFKQWLFKCGILTLNNSKYVEYMSIYDHVTHVTIYW